MKTTVDIPEAEIEDLMRVTRTATKRIAECNRRQRMAALVEHAGQGDSMVTPEELQAQRRTR